MVGHGVLCCHWDGPKARNSLAGPGRADLLKLDSLSAKTHDTKRKILSLPNVHTCVDHGGAGKRKNFHPLPLFKVNPMELKRNIPHASWHMPAQAGRHTKTPYCGVSAPRPPDGPR